MITIDMVPHTTVDFSEVPDGWLVFEIGQSMDTGVWHCTMISPAAADTAMFIVNAYEQDSARDAFYSCIQQIHTATTE